MNLNQEKVKQILEKTTALIYEVEKSKLEITTKIATLKAISNKALATKIFLELNVYDPDVAKK